MIAVIFDLMGDFGAGLQRLTAFEAAMLVMILWISTTIACVMLQYAGLQRRGPGAATLIFGSFTMTALMIAFIVYAGIAA